MLGGVHRCDPQRKTNRTVRGTAPTLAQDAFGLGKLHNIMDGQEVSRIIHPANDAEFVCDQFLDFGRNAIGPAFGGFQPAQLLQPSLRRITGRDRLMRIIIGELGQVKLNGGHQLLGFGNRFGAFDKESRHFCGRLQMALGIGQKQLPCLLDRDFLADAGENIVERLIAGACVKHIIGCNQGKAGFRRQGLHLCKMALVASSPVHRDAQPAKRDSIA